MRTFIIHQSEEGQTLEKYIQKLLVSAPMSFIYKLFRKKDIKVNGHHKDRKFIISTNDEVSIYIKEEQFVEFLKEKEIQGSDAIKDWIVYEDKNVLFINKPRGLLVQKSAPQDKSLDQMVCEYLVYKGEYQPNEEIGFKPGPAHRLDRNTSGIVAFGKTHDALDLLFELFKDHELINKHYLALVVGQVEKDKGTIDAPLLKDEENNIVKVARNGKTAKTVYKLIKKYDDYSLLDVTLLTGRTHQIRVHLSYINHPIVGDSKYGNFNANRIFKEKYHFANQFLHAYKLGFGDLPQPLTNLSRKEFTAEPNEEIANILTMLENNSED
ncbi:MAG: RluA family pseudouridine synthase [Bacilli bacterium]|nr:RluA family pseudouridine synthase [Bacilli bacterium]